MSEENTSKKIARTNFYEQIEKKVFNPALGSNAESGASRTEKSMHSKNLEI